MLAQKNSVDQGFTLLEVMVAVGVIAIALVFLISTLISCLVLNQSAKELNIATSAARAQIEKIQTWNYSEIKTHLAVVGSEKIYTGGAFAVDFPVEGLHISSQDANGSNAAAGYFKIISIDPNDNLVDIQVIVEWRSQNGRHQKIEIWGRRSSRGILS